MQRLLLCLPVYEVSLRMSEGLLHSQATLTNWIGGHSLRSGSLTLQHILSSAAVCLISW